MITAIDALSISYNVDKLKTIDDSPVIYIIDKEPYNRVSITENNAELSIVQVLSDLLTNFYSNDRDENCRKFLLIDANLTFSVDSFVKYISQKHIIDNSIFSYEEAMKNFIIFKPCCLEELANYLVGGIIEKVATTIYNNPFGCIFMNASSHIIKYLTVKMKRYHNQFVSLNHLFRQVAVKHHSPFICILESTEVLLSNASNSYRLLLSNFNIIIKVEVTFTQNNQNKCKRANVIYF